MKIVFEDPPIIISGQTTISEFLKMIPPNRFESRVLSKEASFHANDMCHHGLRCFVGFKFRLFPDKSDELLLRWISFAYKGHLSKLRPLDRLQESFTLLQQHFEANYGAPDQVGFENGFPSYQWAFKDDNGLVFAEAKHYVSDRWGIAEELVITL